MIKQRTQRLARRIEQQYSLDACTPIMDSRPGKVGFVLRVSATGGTYEHTIRFARDAFKADGYDDNGHENRLVLLAGRLWMDWIDEQIYTELKQQGLGVPNGD